MMQMSMQVCHDVNAPLWVCHDVNVHVGMSWCKCHLVGMSWCKCSCMYVMMWMFTCRYAVMRMSLLWVCHDANVLMVHTMMQMPLIGMWWMWMPALVCNECQCLLESMSWYGMLWCKHNLFKNSFYSQNEASTTPETKIFSNSIYYSWKVIFLLT